VWCSSTSIMSKLIQTWIAPSSPPLLSCIREIYVYPFPNLSDPWVTNVPQDSCSSVDDNSPCGIHIYLVKYVCRMYYSRVWFFVIAGYHVGCCCTLWKLIKQCYNHMYRNLFAQKFLAAAWVRVINPMWIVRYVDRRGAPGVVSSWL
jgi:hypothetical protein